MAERAVQLGGNVSDVAAREILLAGARALAHVDGLGPSLKVLIDAITEQCHVESAAIVVTGSEGGLEIVATFGLDHGAIGGLAHAIGSPSHPIAKTFSERTPSFDVLPTVPGGPTLRSHLPLVVTRGGTNTVLGVLALAHDRPVDEAIRPILQAGADLAAVAIERNRVG